jgi:acetyltransferase-like isoleucine patch superfamily enzyme
MKRIYCILFKLLHKTILWRVLLNRITALEKGWAFSPTIRIIFQQFYGIKVGYGSYGGCFEPANIPPGTEFGNYCSIASGVKIFRANHPAEQFTTHPLLYNPVMGLVDHDMLNRPPLEIGHDVWIGSNAIICPRVRKIGNGAIIGAGSVVTKDVPPYTIIAGNPAKIIRKRFSDDIMLKLEMSKWWELSVNCLTVKVPELEKMVRREI